MIDDREEVSSALDENRFRRWLVGLGDADAGETRFPRVCPVARYLRHATGRVCSVAAGFTFDGYRHTPHPAWVREFVLAVDNGRPGTTTIKAAECLEILDGLRRDGASVGAAAGRAVGTRRRPARRRRERAYAIGGAGDRGRRTTAYRFGRAAPDPDVLLGDTATRLLKAPRRRAVRSADRRSASRRLSQSFATLSQAIAVRRHVRSTLPRVFASEISA